MRKSRFLCAVAILHALIITHLCGEEKATKEQPLGENLVQKEEKLLIAGATQSYVIAELRRKFSPLGRVLDYEIYFRYGAALVQFRNGYQHVLVRDTDPLVTHQHWISSGKNNAVPGYDIEEATFEVLEIATSEIERFLNSPLNSHSQTK